MVVVFVCLFVCLNVHAVRGLLLICLCWMFQTSDEDEKPAVVDIEETVPDANKNVELDKTRYFGEFFFFFSCAYLEFFST